MKIIDDKGLVLGTPWQKYKQTKKQQIKTKKKQIKTYK